MTTSKEHWHNNGWLVGIGTGLIVVVLTPVASIITDFIRGINIFSTLNVWWTSISNGFLWLMNFELRFWWILVYFIITSIISTVRTDIKNKKTLRQSEKPINNKQSFLNYRSDRLKNWTWEWEWKFNSTTNKFQINNLTALCPSCQTILNTYNGDFSCPRCERNFPYYLPHTEKINDIETLILDNIKKGNYPSDLPT